MSKSQVTHQSPVTDRRRKLRKWRILLEDRLEALDLMAQGKTIDQIVEQMAKKHSTWPPEKVRSVYFPQGLYSIHQFEGAAPEVIEQAKARLAKNHATNQKSGGKVFKELHQDSEFARQTRERSSRLMMALHQDPVFAAQTVERGKQAAAKLHQNPAYARAAGKRMKELHQDLEFVRKKQEGLARLWTPEKREEARRWMLQLREDPEIMARMSAARAEASRRPEARERARQQITELNQDPEFQRTRLAGLARAWGDPEFVQWQRERLRLWNQDPDFLAKVTEGQVRYWTSEHRQEASQRMFTLFGNPEFIAARQEFWSEENREIARQRMLERRKEPAFQLAFMASKSRLWRNPNRERRTCTLNDLGMAVVSRSREGWPNIGYVPRVMHEERHGLIQEALAELELIERKVVEMAFFPGHKVGKQLDMPAEEVAIILKRSLAKLAQNQTLRALL